MPLTLISPVALRTRQVVLLASDVLWGNLTGKVDNDVWGFFRSLAGSGATSTPLSHALDVVSLEEKERERSLTCTVKAGHGERAEQAWRT